jgi:hypothetical protein
MSKHTQGPWNVKLKPRKWNPTMCCPESEVWAIKGPDKKHSPVATVRVAGYGMGPSMAVRKANAILIAAAPDLLAASEAFISELDSGSDFTAWEKAKADLREAINKATGADQ